VIVPTVPLASIAEVKLGRQRSPQNHTGPSMRKYLRAANVGWSGLILHDVKSMNFTESEMATFRLQPGDILLNEASGSPGEVGKPALWNGEVEDCAFQNTLLRVRPTAEADSRYLLHYFSRQASGGAFARGSRGVGIHHLGRDALSKWPVPLPPLDEQRRIAAILDQADALRAKSREVVESVNQLAQSIFVDSFGDPTANPRGYPRAMLGDVIRSASDGPHVSPQYAAEGIPFLSTRHVKPGRIVWEDLKFLSPDDAAVQWRKCRPTRGDVLYTKGGTTGIAAAVNDDREFAVWVHVAVLTPLADRVNSTWLEAMLNTAHCYRQSQRLTHGIANHDLGLKRMVNIEILLPPIEEQNRYADDVARVRTTADRSVVQVSKSNQLFASLQSRAFSRQL
jgi:type I restriction enzyme, S subunit